MMEWSGFLGRSCLSSVGETAMDFFCLGPSAALTKVIIHLVLDGLLVLKASGLVFMLFVGVCARRALDMMCHVLGFVQACKR